MDMPPPQPAPRLRPLNLVDILDNAFRLYRNNFLTFLGIVALLQVPLIVVQLLMTLTLGQTFVSDITEIIQRLQGFDPSEDSFNQLPLGNIALFYGVSIVLALLQGLIVQPLIQGGLIHAVAQRYMGRPISIASAYRGVVRHLGSLIGAGLLLGLLGFVVIGGVVVIGGLLAVMIGAFSSGAEGNGAAIAGVLLGIAFIFGIIILALGVAFVLVRFIFYTQSIVIEEQGAIGSLGRSWNLVRGSYWRVLGSVVTIAVLMYFIVAIPSAIASFGIRLVFSDPVRDFAITQSLSTLVSYIGQMLALPVQLIAYTLLYFDVRVRKEGYDLELMAQQMQQTPHYEAMPPYTPQ